VDTNYNWRCDVKRWQGVTTRGLSIIGKVLAENKALAREEIKRQLEKPGRKGALDQWVHHGSRVKEVK